MLQGSDRPGQFARCRIGIEGQMADYPTVQIIKGRQPGKTCARTSHSNLSRLATAAQASRRRSRPLKNAPCRVYLLSAPLMIPLIYCHINSFRRVSHSNEAMARGENRIGGRTSHHTDFEAIGAFLLLCAATGVSLLAVWRRIGATPRGQPWPPAMALPHGCDGLSAWRMAMLWQFRQPRCRHVRRELMRNAWLDCTLLYLQLLATKEITSRHTVGVLPPYGEHERCSDECDGHF